MNLIELENLVKGVPDEYLTKEVQQPTGKIPPFLALSEIQRRKDMRDRYQAQQGAVEKPTIAEQIVGGIGSLPQPQVGAPPAPAMPGGMGAPPIAAGAAPMPTPPGIPQGFAAGGLVKMAAAGQVPSSVPSDYVARYPWRYGLSAPPPDPTTKRIDEIKARLAQNDKFFGLFGSPLDSQQRTALESELYKLENSGTREGVVTPVVPATRPAAAPPPAGRAAPAARPAVPAAGAPAPTGRGSAATETAGPAPVVSRGGIGEFPVPAITPIPGAPAAKGLRYETDAEARYADLLDPTKNPDMFKLPEAINYDEFIQAAAQEEAAIRTAAKQEALGAALVQLGAGLAAGNMAAGFSEAGQQAQQVMKEGRRDAAAQKALAQELKLRGMEGKREQAVQQSRMTLQGAELSAQLARQTRQEQEERAHRDQQTAIAAAERRAARADRARSFDLSLKQYNLEMRRDAAKTFDQFLENEIGPPPSAKEYSDWQKLPEDMRGPDPRQSYIELRKQAAPSAAARTQRVYPEIELSFYGAAASAGDRKAQREAREKDYKYPRPKEIRGNINKEHVQYLRENPSYRDAFNQKFGKGWAEYYLDN